VIRACTGVEDLACWLNLEEPCPSLVEAILALRPKKLSGRLITLTGSIQPDFGLGFFSRVTHLDIIDECSQWKAWSDLYLLRSLTHLACGSIVDTVRYGPSDPLVQFITTLLERCPSLRVCILNDTWPYPELLSKAINLFKNLSDPRLLFSCAYNPLGVWQMTSLGMDDIWRLAEKKVQEKSSTPEGLFHIYCPCICEFIYTA
jgi:hypothetical protein